MKKPNKKDKSATGRFWEELPIVEATHELRVFVEEQDINGAKVKDWGNCVFARACARLFGSRRVAFFRYVAYVELPQEDGSRVAERFYLTKAVSEQIRLFDKTHTAPPGGFLLLPPKPSHKLAQKDEYRKRHDKAVINGTAQRHKKHYRNPLELDWRSGSGMVHFKAKKKGVPQISAAP